MGCYNYMKIMCVLTTIMLLGLHNVSEARALEGETWLWKGKNYVVFHSLQRRSVNDSQKNPCSTVPGRSKGHCTSSDMNIAGYVIADDTKIKGLGWFKMQTLEDKKRFRSTSLRVASEQVATRSTIIIMSYVTVLDCLRVKKLFYLMIPGHVTWARRRIVRIIRHDSPLLRLSMEGDCECERGEEMEGLKKRESMVLHVFSLN
ncbi:unnamed protein product [Lupinus luteus]|uniref:Uncharacterized protein n=1 Tax=Lupinus luteus TaxID=3873 RepID=A0AAV1X1K7_LUPLU